ncbi:hypothetical protein K474DRAFT_1714253 [Panus rudis PR-1116 ss-1]|nr:hypothetical protein K474DRAFT_1714253 [Panus rudis PR-1116 ss-1]
MVQDTVIPFPTLAHDPDEPKESGDRPPHSRVRSSPTCPSGRRTQHRASPHVSPLQSPHRSTLAFGTPRCAPPTLTPPLTPSGSFSSQNNDGAPVLPVPPNLYLPPVQGLLPWSPSPAPVTAPSRVLQPTQRRTCGPMLCVTLS